MENIIYVAINKTTGKVMSGAKGQYAFDNTVTLGRSIGQAYRYTAQRQGVKVKDLYSVHEIDLDLILPMKEVQS